MLGAETLEEPIHEQPAKPNISNYLGYVATSIGLFCTILTAILWVSTRTENNTWVNTQQEQRLADHEARLRSLEDTVSYMKRAIDGMSDAQKTIRNIGETNGNKIDKILDRLSGKL